LYRATETLRWLCVLLYPIMPEATKNIYAQIGLIEEVSKVNPENLTWGELKTATEIGETKAVFPRIDKTKVMKEVTENGKLKMENQETKIEEQKIVINEQSATTLVENTTDVLINSDQNALSEEENFITIDDFLKVELRVGEIKVAERIPKADKLLRFEIDLGEEKPRQILAGLAEYYEPETLVGRKVVVVANLKPRKMRGLESQGMICAASLENSDDTPAIATFLEDVQIGARLK
jgi:methionyl-tRNA synthetase